MMRNRRGLWLVTTGLSGLLVIGTPVKYRSVPASKSAYQAAQSKDSSNELRSLLAELIDAIKRKDGSREKQLIGNLVMPKDGPWFAAHFDKSTAELLRSAYQESMKDFETTTRRLYEADVQRGPIDIHVNRYADPKTVPDLFPAILQSMTVLDPLYEVSVSGGRPTFQIALSATGGPSKIVAGDLDGYFVETAEGFRYVPSSVLMIAVQERAKRDYEILSQDADDRPTVVRMKGGGLAGMIVDRAYPTYPESARAKRIEGEVIVTAHIGKDGRVREVSAKSGPPELRKAATDAMKKWRFKPIHIDGHPVEVEADFVFNMSFAPN